MRSIQGMMAMNAPIGDVPRQPEPEVLRGEEGGGGQVGPAHGQSEQGDRFPSRHWYYKMYRMDGTFKTQRPFSSPAPPRRCRSCLTSSSTTTGFSSATPRRRGGATATGRPSLRSCGRRPPRSPSEACTRARGRTRWCSEEDRGGASGRFVWEIMGLSGRGSLALPRPKLRYAPGLSITSFLVGRMSDGARGGAEAVADGSRIGRGGESGGRVCETEGRMCEETATSNTSDHKKHPASASIDVRLPPCGTLAAQPADAPGLPAIGSSDAVPAAIIVPPRPVTHRAAASIAATPAPPVFTTSSPKTPPPSSPPPCSPPPPPRRSTPPRAPGTRASRPGTKSGPATSGGRCPRQRCT